MEQLQLLMPREKLLKLGSGHLLDYELVAIFLRTGIQGMDVISLSKLLLDDFGSLQALLNADQTQICQYRGLGESKYVQLKAILEIGRRYYQESMQRHSQLNNPSDTKKYLVSLLRGQRREVFCVLFLDNQHRLIKSEILFEGTINQSHVYPREVVRRALELDASAVILAHNHPSGVRDPSLADKQVTAHIKSALKLVDISLLDHFIIGDNEPTSLAQLGYV